MQPMTHSALTLFIIFVLSYWADQIAAVIGDHAWAWSLVAVIAYGACI